MNNYDFKMNKIHHIDCLQFMKNIPDNYFDLVLTDPPYGINIVNNGNVGGKDNKTKLAKVGDYSFASDDWDKQKPSKEYFNEICRVSKNQIIFGANHFIESMPINSSCWLVWDKDNEGSNFADCELAWTSFSSAVRKYKYRWNGMLQEDMKNKEKRIHPTMKPLELFKRILMDYTKKGDKIFDPFMGGGTTACAAKSLDLEWVGCELELEYIIRAENRIRGVNIDIFGL